MAPTTLHRQLYVYANRTSYSFVPVESEQDHFLRINRTSGEISLGKPPSNGLPAADLKIRNVYGIMGIISLAITDYVVLLTGREIKGQLMGHDIYRATSFKILPISSDESIRHHATENYLLALLKSHLNQGWFWFSYDYDLTRRLQAQAGLDDSGKPLWQLADDRFFWNKFLQTRFINITSADRNTNLSPFILPIMFGTFDIRSTTLNDRSAILCLISRRSRYRAGTRYFRRGIDSDGHVANFNETEQILLVDRQGKPKGDLGTILSYVQIRGSIPLYWAEVNNLRYKPALNVMERPDSIEAMRRHLQEQTDIYGEQHLVNLLNHEGHEKPVKDAFENMFSELQLPRAKYEYFDFHTECKKSAWGRLSLLLDRLEQDLIREGYFHLDADNPEPIKMQHGVVRTNCMDNLDRTNVTQSAIAKWVLNRQLQDVGVFSTSETVEMYADFMSDFRSVWADHADLISRAYSGTGALKTDFTRTGKRTYLGLLDDGVNSVMRYLKNNYFDGPRQDAFDLVTGGWTPRRGSAATNTLLVDSRPIAVRSVPYIVWASVFMICAGLTLPRTSDYSLLYWFALWITLLTASLLFIYFHGVDYVSWPRLVPLTDIIYYEGPGFKSPRKGHGFRSGGRGLKGVNIGSKSGDAWASRARASSRANEVELGTKQRID